MKKLLILILLTPTVYAKTAHLILSKHPVEVTSLMESTDKLDLKKTRTLCNYLTDVDILNANNGYLFPKRRKSYRRHIKEICDDLEYTVWTDSHLTENHINQLYELNLIKASMDHKAKEDAQGMTLIDKLRMGLTSFLRKNDFSYDKKVSQYEAMNLNLSAPLNNYTLDELALIDPKDSPYYTHPKGNDPLYKRFGKIADTKKIKYKSGHMVMIFDGESISGSAPKIKTIDTNLDDEWSLKWGDELHTDVVGSRLFAALGFDVDHPYYREKDSVTVVFPNNIPLQSKTAGEMVKNIQKYFKVDISRFISKTGVVDDAMAQADDKLKPYVGLHYVTFIECAIEGRPDRVKRLGGMMHDSLFNRNRRELRGALLAHLWIDNWDTRHENTMMALNHQGDRTYNTTGVFSDLGTSLGVKVNYFPTDFRVGLVNHFPWDIVKKNSDKKLHLLGQINAFLKPYEAATYADLKWMAHKIAQITEEDLDKILEKSGWPKGLQKLYFYKLANRRAQILSAFDIQDPHPIKIKRNYTYEKDGVVYIKEGVLIKDFNKEKHPLGYLETKGRLRNYGQASGSKL